MYTKKPWIEKYRPQTIDKVALSVQNREIYKNILETGYFPHLLLYGSPGTGKTTFIINMIKEFNKNTDSRNIIHLNASDDRGIDVIRNQIYTFISTQDITTADDTLKFVILDEVDYMTKSAQLLLKSLFKIVKNVRFCLICNYISKIIPSIQNLCMKMFFMNAETCEVKDMLNTICKEEKIKVSNSIINSIIDTSYPDIRNMVNLLQLHVESKRCNESKTVISINTIQKSSKNDITSHLNEMKKTNNINTNVKIVKNMMKRKNLSFYDYLRIIIEYCIEFEITNEIKQMFQELYRDNINCDNTKIQYYVCCLVPKLNKVNK